eukprot:TRINITY_DN11904_c0_g1_i16.p1 TRINITY_DN11904_c0_g1~~TRINITY_DN11904_c0_g1_i16.p1  ORF type:complete len:138 (+),score=19.42 TRINITY_DN11904_c0_g1_i16:75-488(+)
MRGWMRWGQRIKFFTDSSNFSDKEIRELLRKIRRRDVRWKYSVRGFAKKRISKTKQLFLSGASKDFGVVVGSFCKVNYVVGSFISCLKDLFVNSQSSFQPLSLSSASCLFGLMMREGDGRVPGRRRTLGDLVWPRDA